jgi:Tfp pilus assembly protein PilE
MRHEEGFTVVEVIIAAVILLVGVLTALTAMTAARKLSLVSERRTSMAHRAQLELERVKSLPYGQIALTSAASSGAGAWSTTASAYTYVSVPGGSCPASPAGTAPTYQPDHRAGGSTATEPLVINGCTYTISGSATPTTTGALAPVTAWSDGNLSGYVYDFVTWTSDPTCSQSSTPGSVCATSNDYKRVTIVVTLTGVTEPSHPVILSSFVADPNQNSSANLLTNPSTSCGGASCSVTPPGTPNQYFPCDSSYSSGSCGQPPCSGNVLHKTLVNLLGLLGLAPVPDLLGSGLPSGACTGSGGTPTPPCYATDLSAGCQGLPIAPTGTTCGSSPPLDNTKSHSWVTPAVAVGTTFNGNGSLTAYLQSGNGVAVNVTVCLGLYIVPGGILGSLLGNLLQSPIGVTVSANVTVQAGVPTPVSFNFDTLLNSTVSVSVLGTRIEAVVWLAASAGTNVSLAYDQAQFASQITLMTTT